MKINGPGQPPAAGVTDAESTKAVSGAPSGSDAGESGRVFADKLDRAAGPTLGAVGAPAGGVPLADLAAELRSGRLGSRAAVDELVNRIVAQQVGPQAPAGLREQVRAALRGDETKTLRIVEPLDGTSLTV